MMSKLLFFVAVTVGSVLGQNLDPSKILDLRTFGVHKGSLDPDPDWRVDFADKISALDAALKLEALSGKVVVFYSTENSTQPLSVPRRVTAWFIDVALGKLLRTQSWAALPKAWNNSEGQLLALADGCYVFMARSELWLYNPDGSLLANRKLNSSEWLMETFAGEPRIFLEHRSRTVGDVACEWLDPHTLGSAGQVECDRVYAPVLLTAAASRLRWESDGLHKVTPDGLDPLVCGSPLCAARTVTFAQAIYPPGHLLMILTTIGSLTVLDSDGRVAWSRLATLAGVVRGSSEIFVEGPALIATSGVFLIHVWRGRHTPVFDGVKLSNNGTNILYSVAKARPIGSIEGTYFRAFSSDGSKLFLLDDRLKLKVFSLVQ